MIFLKRCCLFTAIIFFLSTINLYAQDRPRIAVIPLNPISVTKSDSSTLTGLLETGLVKTEAFDVIEQTQVEVILKTQEYMLSDFTDERSAVEFGKLLAAEQIILGSVSKIGGKYIVNAKIIDVETGQHIKADNVDADSLESLTEKIELLAYKLAGLPVTLGEREEIAKVFGEIFVETVPEGAEVYVNGVRKGTSPTIIEKVPQGTIFLEVRKGDMYGSREVEIKGEEVVKVKLALARSLGRIFIQVGEKYMYVYLDGNRLGLLGSGLFEDIPAGEHKIVLEGVGLFWEGSVKVTPNATAKVEAYPREVGLISYSIPDGAKAEIKGNNLRKIVQGFGNIGNVPTDTYEVKITGNNYKSESMTIEVSKAETTFIEPQLEYTDEYKATLKRERMELEREEREKEIASLISLKADLEKTYENSIVRRKKRTTAGWVTFGSTIAMLAGMGVFIYLSEDTYDKYQNAQYTADAINFREEYRMWQGFMTTTGVSGGALGLISIVLFNTRGNPEKIRQEIIRVELRLDALQGGME